MREGKNAIITIFTPVYNRAKTLVRLYESLKQQTNQSFIWVIVNDGSIDNTEELVNQWIKENLIEIEYFYQDNSGKPIAHNVGVQKTKTELFTCVDSDDYLKNDAVEKLISCWNQKKNNNSIGILAYKEKEQGEVITQFKNDKMAEGTLREFYDSGLRGDTFLVYRSDVIKKYEFPKYEEEKFVPEAYLYDLMDQEGKLILLKESLYIAEYLEDGYTANMAILLYRNQKGYFTYINQRLKFDTTLRQKCSDTIRYLGMAIAHSKKNIISNAVYPSFAFLLYGAGYLFYYKRYRNVIKEKK